MTMIEVLVAITITGVAATGLAGMAYWAGKNSLVASISATRLAALTSLSERLSATPYGALDAAAGCTEIGGSTASGYTQCIRVEEASPGLKRVTIFIVPNSETVRPDSVVIERSSTASSSPF